mgnify:CR=1 FL=1
MHAFGGTLELLLFKFPHGLSWMLAKAVAESMLEDLQKIHKRNESLGGLMRPSKVRLLPNPQYKWPFIARLDGTLPIPFREDN